MRLKSKGYSLKALFGGLFFAVLSLGLITQAVVLLRHVAE